MSSLTPYAKKHLFVINPRSFLKAKDISRVIAEITRCFQEFQEAPKLSSNEEDMLDLPTYYSPESLYAIHISRFPRDSIIIIRKYISLVGEETPVRIYAIGGDGIVFGCLNGIMGLPNTELAIIPYGTGTDFVMSFGGKEVIPEMRNIKAQIQAPTIPVDVIDYGNFYALNSCVVGFEAMALRWCYPILNTFWKIRRRFPVVTSIIMRIAGIVKIFDKKVLRQRYQIQMDDKTIEGSMGVINIANSPGYPINISVIPEAMPDDGLLDIVVYRKSSSRKMKTVKLMSYYLKGQHSKFPESYIYRRVRYVSIKSDRPFGITLDGEVFFDTSATIRVVPKAVQIVSVGGRPFKNRSLGYEK
jgi:diacylglycerol kinase family enzyme